MNTPWSKHAACRGLDPIIFFPLTDEDEAAAKQVCDGCAVRELCLEHALGQREREGIWGGCTERERRRIIRRRRQTAS